MTAPPSPPAPSAIDGFPRTRLVLAVGFVLLLAALVGVVVLGLRFAKAENWVQHTLNVRQLVQSLGAAIQETESTQRNYLISGDDTYATASEEAQREALRLREALAVLTHDNEDQAQRLAHLSELLQSRLALIIRGIELTRSGRQAEAMAIARDGRGRAMMREIDSELNAVDQEETRLFTVRQTAADSERISLMVAIVSAILIGLGLGIVAVLVNNRYMAALTHQNEALVREIAQREVAEAQLRQSQKMEALGRLTGGIAHDFNNMLSIIAGNLEMILRRVEQGPERVKPLATNALEGAKRAALLTQRLLAFSRQMPLAPRPLDANRVVTGVMDMLNRALGERIVVETVLGAGVWRINADEPQLESALLNLAINARDAIGESGKLTIETSNGFLDEHYARAHGDVAPGQYVLISMTDNGHGMTPDIIANAFEPFFTTKAAGAGTGLGLSQVHGFIKQSGGHIKIYSEPKVGTTVKLYFPRYTGSAEVAAPEAVPATARKPLDCKVLLVEDEAGVRAFVASALGDLGCQVVEAENAETAIKQLEANSDVTVLLTDVVMPGKSGRELADAAREMRPDLKVLFMTGYTRNAIVHNGMLDSGTHLLTKPFTLAELELRLERLLREKA